MDNPHNPNNNNNNSNNNVVIPSDSSTSSSSSISNNRDQFLRHLNKLSHKISKPPPPSSSSSSIKPHHHHHHPQPPSFNPSPPPPLSHHQQLQQHHQQQQQQQQQQPPVYNINKSDFRDVVQKLTGSPAHAPPPPSHAPPPPQQHPHQIHPQPKPASSRLQRIRPPPLAQLTTRPPHLLTPSSSGNPLSPLPPLPTCHAAAESPISAYMRFLHTSVEGAAAAAGFNRMIGQMPPPSSSLPPPSSNTVDVPNYGWFPSPKSPCQLLSPNLLFSPTGNGGPLGFPQLPLSPTVPGVPSPK